MTGASEPGATLVTMATEVPVFQAYRGTEPPPDDHPLLHWMGGYFEINWSVNPHWTAKFEKFPDHPVTKGVKPFETNDEWYYHMRFREGMKGVTPILTAVPPDSTRKGKDSTHGGNPTVREEIGKNTPEHVMWVSENEGGGHVHIHHRRVVPKDCETARTEQDRHCDIAVLLLQVNRAPTIIEEPVLVLTEAIDDRPGSE